jgi:hypothetical protein
MCDTCPKAPIDRLYDASRAAMTKLYPEHAAKIEAGKHDRIAEIFAADAMSEKGQSSLPHRLDDPGRASGDALRRSLGFDDRFLQGKARRRPALRRRVGYRPGGIRHYSLQS